MEIVGVITNEQVAWDNAPVAWNVCLDFPRIASNAVEALVNVVDMRVAFQAQLDR